MDIHRVYPQSTGLMLEMIGADGELIEVHRGGSFISLVGKNIPLDLTERRLIEELEKLIQFVENFK